MKELLLVGFNTFEGGAKAANISENIKHLDVRVKIIKACDYNMPVGAMLDNDAFLNEHFLSNRIYSLKNDAKKTGPYNGPDPENKYIIICNIPRNELDNVLNILSESGITKNELKAVLTPVNACFSFLQLADELSKEHKALNRKN